MTFGLSFGIRRESLKVEISGKSEGFLKMGVIIIFGAKNLVGS